MRKIIVLILSFLMMMMSFAMNIKGKVIKIADGDTITIQTLNNERIKVRLYGIDAPEKKQDYGIKSLDVLKELSYGKTVDVEVKEKDRYGRTVGIVFLNGEEINLKMIETGNAWHYKKYAKEKANYSNAEAEARKSKLGLWNSDKQISPWEYRKINN